MLNDYERIVNVMPPNGWRVRFRDGYGSTAKTWTAPLVGWGLTAAGEVVPLAQYSSWSVAPVRELHHESLSVEVYHPMSEPEKKRTT
ncbi:hypothetical protein ABT332_06590 [Saccharomonospora azurea]|uniref:hypothetical protein n=1 Tax=Saccharomonospora azurea TaxID=40988 RepID=UPI0033216841